MQKTVYQRPDVNFKKKRKSVTIPDQAMSIQEIIKRYVKGIPVQLTQREETYIDQEEYDLEKLNRMDFADKSALADELRDKAEAQKSDLIARDEARRNKRKKERESASKPAQEGGHSKPLDITMPDDTNDTKK